MASKLKYNKGEDLFDVPRLTKELGIPEQTGYTRFRSRYAKERWGVNFYEMAGGTYKKFVHKKDLALWKEPVINYKGRPAIKR